jgi:hypothetical protein
LQSGSPAASGGFVAVELEPVAVELVLLFVLGAVLLPLLVLGVSLRTCLVTASQHLALVVVVVALGVLVVVEVCATASPKLPVSMAAAISPIPAIRIRYSFLMVGDGDHSPRPWGNGDRYQPFLVRCVTKKEPHRRQRAFKAPSAPCAPVRQR